MAESWEDRAKTLLRKRSADALRVLRAAVRPMYRNSSAQVRPEHIGTCILLSVDGHPVLATAAHILDNLTEGWALYVGGSGSTAPVPIRGGVRGATPIPDGGRERDHFDNGFWKIPEDAVRELGDVEYLDASRISHPATDPAPRYYMAMGYRLAAHKSAIDHRERLISNRLSRYSGSVAEIPKLADKLGVSGAEHMFLSFPKYGQDEDDRRIRAFGPVGFSGGPLVDLGDFTSEEAYSPDYSHRPTVSGMLIEHQSAFQAMVAVKMAYVYNGLRLRLASSAA